MIKSRHTAIAKFSSPSGDGLVLLPLAKWTIEEAFSSPLGDGLVPTKKTITNSTKGKFSSPLGDGLVLGNTV